MELILFIIKSVLSVVGLLFPNLKAFFDLFAGILG